ncbi:MAG: Holliday junction resolvase RuvX [Phycisphaerae bacterium]|nr:Holliday junction resolvase RuvX [Phycisphaerae bacterium]
MRYLAIDHGRKRTGLAICDPSETIVSPFAVLDNPKNICNQITDVIKAQSVEAVVVGLPLNMDGSQGFQAKLVLAFAEQLKKSIDIPIYFQDERLSTFGAEEKLAATELSRKKKRKRLDAVAAAGILENFLESGD